MIDSIDATTLTLDDFQDRTRAGVAYPRCRIILDDGEPMDAPWLLPLLGMIGHVGHLSASYTTILEKDRGVLTRDSAKIIGLVHCDVLQDLARLADAQSKRMSDIARLHLARLAERMRRAKAQTMRRREDKTDDDGETLCDND